MFEKKLSRSLRPEEKSPGIWRRNFTFCTLHEIIYKGSRDTHVTARKHEEKRPFGALRHTEDESFYNSLQRNKH
jgi:hypothetical protein